jgi:hypothetical protein
LAKLKFAKPQSIILLKFCKCILQPKNISIIYFELWKSQKIILKFFGVETVGKSADLMGNTNEKYNCFFPFIGHEQIIFKKVIY